MEMNLKLKNKRNKGITLIALVITIIVLLILAAVSIATLTGENGLLTKATKAGEDTDRETAEEEVKVAVMGSYGNDGKIDIGELNDNLRNIPKLTYNGRPIDERGTEGGNRIDELPADVDVDGHKVHIDGQGNVTVEGKKEDTSKTDSDWSEPYEKTKEYEKDPRAIIPKGFSVSLKTGEDTVNGGLVVRAPDESEFVWVPVDKNTFSTKFKRTEGYSNKQLQESYLMYCGEADKTGENSLLDESQATKSEATAMYDSVYQNGGFYIARYEAGLGEDGKVVSQKGVKPYTSISWGDNITEANTKGAVKESREMAQNNEYEEVKSTLCYGVQWDAALNFIDPKYITNEKANNEPNCDEDSCVRNGTDNGWYSDNTSANSEHITGFDVDGVNNKQKNIYDMAGNAYEWTMESYSSGSRILRGGSFNNSAIGYPASYRFAHLPSWRRPR